MTAARVLAIHLTESALWARSGETGFVCPATVYASPAGPVFGVEFGRSDPAAYERHPIRYVDDRYLALGESVFPMTEVLAGLLAHAAAGCGLDRPADLVVLTHPANWGRGRRGVLSAAGRTVGREVTLVSVPDAVRRAAGADRETAVLEVGLLASTVSASGSPDCVHLGEWGSADLNLGEGDGDPADSPTVPGRPGRAGEWVAALVAACPRWPARVLVTGELPVGKGPVLLRALESGGCTATVATEISGAEVVAGALALVSATLPTALPDAAWREPADPTPPHGGRPRRRWVAAALGAVATVTGLAVVGAGVLRSPDGTAAAGSTAAASPASDAAPAEPVATEPTVAQQVAPTTERGTVGRVELAVPPGWGERAGGRRPDRLELVRDDGGPARILLVQKELTPGADLDAVARTLRQRIAERPGVFRSLERAPADGREALTYREIPDPDSEVRWHVYVADGLQVSVGCQSPADRWAELAGACDQAIRSTSVTLG